MSRKINETDFFKLVKIYQPKIVYMRKVSGIFNYYTEFWYNDKNGVSNVLSENCTTCIPRIKQKLKKSGIELIEVD
jgi:hypothetical protein